MKWIIGIVIVLAGVFLILRKNKSGSSIEKVAVEKAAKRTIIETVSTSGKIYPVTEIRVSPDFSGQVTDLKVAEGDTVKKGQVLAWINGRSSIESSINGIVLSLKVKKGESVTGNSFSVGTEVMTIADMSQLEIRADVGENDINKVAVGDSAMIRVDAYNNRVFRGVVKTIANSTKTGPGGLPATGDITNYEVKILLDTASYRDLSGKSFPFKPRNELQAPRFVPRKVENVLFVPNPPR